jgi:hypothetical protein
MRPIQLQVHLLAVLLHPHALETVSGKSEVAAPAMLRCCDSRTSTFRTHSGAERRGPGAPKQAVTLVSISPAVSPPAPPPGGEAAITLRSPWPRRPALSVAYTLGLRVYSEETDLITRLSVPAPAASPVYRIPQSHLNSSEMRRSTASAASSPSAWLVATVLGLAATQLAVAQSAAEIGTEQDTLSTLIPGTCSAQCSAWLTSLGACPVSSSPTYSTCVCDQTFVNNFAACAPCLATEFTAANDATNAATANQAPAGRSPRSLCTLRTIPLLN